MKNFDWIYEIKDYEHHLRDAIKDRDDLKILWDLLAEHSGTEAFIRFNEEFIKTGIKPIEEPFNRLKKIYVYQHRNDPIDKLARKLWLDKRTIFKWKQEFGSAKVSGYDNKTIGLFDQEN